MSIAQNKPTESTELGSKWLPIYYRFEKTVAITLHQERPESIFVAHEYRIYLRELGRNFSYTTGLAERSV